MRAKVIVACAALALFAQSAYGDGCEPIVAAQIKGLTVPTTSRITTEFNGVTMLTFENVTLDGKIYSRTNGGAWEVEPMSLTEDKIKKLWSGSDCSLIGSEMVAGETADVYSQASSHGIVVREWIGRSSGMVLKSSMTVQNGGTTSTFDYRDVRAPDTASP
jgi:hypothetical protein